MAQSTKTHLHLVANNPDKEISTFIFSLALVSVYSPYSHLRVFVPLFPWLLSVKLLG